jgi:hypothetical protein
MPPRRRKIRVFLLPVLVSAIAVAASASPILSGSYSNYTLTDLGSIAGVAAGFTYDGLAFNGSQLLLSGGVAQSANPGSQTVYTVPVNRTASGQIVSLGTATQYASIEVVPFHMDGNDAAGGLLFAPDGTLLYTTSSLGYIGQYSPSTTTSSLTSVAGIPLGGLGYLPNGKLVLAGADGSWYPVTLSSPGGNGLYQITVSSIPLAGVNAPAFSFVTTPIGVGGSPGSVLVGDSNNQELLFYGLDANGNPTGAVSEVVSGNGQDVGDGLVQDPSHLQSYLFTTSNDDVWLLTVDAPEPSPTLLIVGGAALLFAAVRKRHR